METELTTQFINLGAIGAGFFLLLRNQIKQNSVFLENQNRQVNFFIDKMDEIAQSVKQIATNVGKTVLDKDQTITIFTTILSEHIEKKLCYIREVLINNHLKQRHDQIVKNIGSKIKSITQEEANKLSQFNTPAGDLGNILLNNVNYDTFTQEVCDIVFCENGNDLKLKDLKELMNGYVTELVKIIQEKIKENQ